MQQPNYSGASSVSLHSFIVDEGGNSELVTVSDVSAQSAAIDATSAIVSPSVDCHVRQGEPDIETGSIVAQDGGTEGDTVTAGTITLTLDDTPTGENQLATEATAAALAAAVYAKIIAHSAYPASNFTVSYVSGATINVFAKVPGDSLTLSETGTSFVTATTPNGPIALDDGSDQLILGGNSYRLVGIAPGNKLAFILVSGGTDGYVSITPGV